jgi:hypothetical protein
MDKAQLAIATFERDHGLKYSKAVKIVDDARRAARVLHVSGRALEPYPHDEPHRIDLRDCTFEDQSDEGPRLANSRRADGLQAD